MSISKYHRTLLMLSKSPGHSDRMSSPVVLFFIFKFSTRKKGQILVEEISDVRRISVAFTIPYNSTHSNKHRIHTPTLLYEFN